MSPRCYYFKVAIVLLTVLCLGCAAASSPVPSPLPEPSSPTLQVGDTTVVALSPPAAPCCKKQTLPQFLGLDKLAGGLVGLVRNIGARISSRLDLAGRFPAIQDPPPPVLAITDPANLSPDSPPSVQAAAEVKAEEDAAAQKVQALKYLATIGCGGCYPSVEDALLAALDDCTEEVRFEGAKALRGSDAACRYCKSNACCSPKVRKKLYKIAYEMDDDNCPYEASERVRREARLSLTACGGYVETESDDDVPNEGPEAPAPTETVTNERTSIHDTIELVSYAESVATHDADDIVLARVNGEQIFESQVAPLVKLELKRQGIDEDTAEHQKLYRPELRRQLARVIDSTRLRQSARQGLRLQQAPTKEQVATWLDQQIDFNQHVDAAEIAAVYARDIHKYNTPAKIRWERISVPLFNFDSRDQAHMVVSFLMHRASGTQVQTPPGFNPQAIENQTHPWSTRKQIASRRIAEMLFKLPVGQLSPIIEDQRAFHLVRVLERVAPRVTSQEDVAGEIRQQILQQRREAAGKQLLVSLVQRSDIWTAFQTAPSTTTTAAPDALSQVAPSHESEQPEIAHQLNVKPAAATTSQATPSQATLGQATPQQSTSISAASGVSKPVAATQQVGTQDINRDPPSFPSLPQLPSQSTAGRVDPNVARTSATIPIDSHPGITLEKIAIRPQTGDGSRTSATKLRRLPPP